MRHATPLIAALLLLPAALLAQRIPNDTLALPVELPTGQYALAPASWGNAVLTLSSPPGITDQLYLGERAGRIRVIPDWPNSEPATTPFLDISSRVVSDFENGLLGVAFHPQYATNGHVFVFYCTRATGRLTNRLSRFTRLPDQPLRADPNSERILLDQRDDAGNHNGGDIHFGPDGYLYIALGDEGGGDDNYQNSQRIDRDFFAGIARIDVDRLPTSVEPTAHPAIPLYDGFAAFAVPADNPLVPIWQEAGANPASPLRLEFYAIGLRNPWRFSFDAPTGELWVGDVGQGAREEIGIVTRGSNHGWATREGTLPGPRNQTPPAGFGAYVDPIYEYDRSLGYSVTGGVVYRGAALPELYGAYIFGDFGSGNIFALQRNPGGGAPTVSIIANAPFNFEFGQDPANGDVLVAASSGAVQRLVRGSGSPGPAFPATLAATGAFASLDTLQPEPGIHPYEPRLPFWSDHARKRRWVSVPGDATIAFQQDTPWTFPTGTVWIKHFDLDLERGNPATARRVETRFLVKTDQGAYGLSYQWNPDGTAATLVPAEGASIDFQVTVDGQPETQTWSIPSRQQCLSCHTPAAGFALSFNTRQLNHSAPTPGATPDVQNQLAYLASLGLFTNPPPAPETLPRHHLPDDVTATLEDRARSYLAVNCASCHLPNGGAPYTWDARPQLDLAATRLVNGIASNPGNDPDQRLVTPGSPARSLLLHRLSAAQGLPSMPPIGSSQTDHAAIELLTRWINAIATENLTFPQWQAHHFGSDDHPDAAPHLDPDHDGNSNRLEYLNRTLPLDPASAWRPSFASDGQTITLAFPMAPGRSFKIQSSDDLSTWTDWPAPGNPPASHPEEITEAQITAPLPASTTPAFLRIEVTE